MEMMSGKSLGRHFTNKSWRLTSMMPLSSFTPTDSPKTRTGTLARIGSFAVTSRRSMWTKWSVRASRWTSCKRDNVAVPAWSEISTRAAVPATARISRRNSGSLTVRWRTPDLP